MYCTMMECRTPLDALSAAAAAAGQPLLTGKPYDMEEVQDRSTRRSSRDLFSDVFPDTVSTAF